MHAVNLLHLPRELVQCITRNLPLQARVEFHLMCKRLYSDLQVPLPRLSTLKGHAHAMLLLMCKRSSLQPADTEYSCSVFLEIETRHPSQLVRVSRQSPGIVCVAQEDNLKFLREEELFRKLALCQDEVHRVSLVIGQDKQLASAELQHITLFMTKVVDALPIKYSGEIRVYTQGGLHDVVMRKVTFEEERFYFDSRLPASPIRLARPDLHMSLPASACALSLVVKEDMYTPYL